MVHDFSASAAEPGLADTVELARTLGASIDATLSPLEQLLSLGRFWEIEPERIQKPAIQPSENT
jgi:hypothetical protein